MIHSKLKISSHRSLQRIERCKLDFYQTTFALYVVPPNKTIPLSPFKSDILVGIKVRLPVCILVVAEVVGSSIVSDMASPLQDGKNLNSKDVAVILMMWVKICYELL